MLGDDLALYIALGFAAQLIDGALGMAYGLISTSVLLASGTPPAIASASVHTAEVATTGLAGASHIWHRNVDWRMVRRLAPAGVIGGALGAYVLTGLPEKPVKVFVTLYLLGMAIVIARRIFSRQDASKRARHIVPVGLGGGFLDAIGGGGWGPMVNSSLIAQGEHPRQSIGSASVCEFFVTTAISAAFLATLDLTTYGQVVLGLIIGGALAAPFAGWFSRTLPKRVLLSLVAFVVGGLGLYNLSQLGG